MKRLLRNRATGAIAEAWPVDAREWIATGEWEPYDPAPAAATAPPSTASSGAAAGSTAEPASPPAKPAFPADLEALKAAELAELAVAYGVPVPAGARKADLVALLETARPTPPEG